jgi:hypothetical protein
MSTVNTTNGMTFTPWRDPAAATALKPLTPTDLGGGRTAGPMKEMTFADHVVGSVNVQKTPHEELVDNTQRWVSQTFYGTILKQMHNSPFKSELFEGGRGGQAFGGLMDQHLADRMARSGNNKLVNGIVRRIEARTAYGRAKQAQVARGGGQAAAEHPNHAKMRSDTDVTAAD